MQGDTTWVTGGSGNRAPKRGDVLAERYEIVESLAEDALVCTYRGLDQESDTPVLVRCTAPGLLGEKDARGMVERIRPLIGGGGRVLSRLRDVDREGTLVLTIEAWPRGTSMRAVLDARRAKGAGTLEPHEVLPVIARLAAALGSIPGSSWHGDVRAERLWLDPDGLVLTGGFLLAALPGDVMAGALGREDDAARPLFAPEVAEGLGGRASDRWGAAAIVWEALTGAVLAPGPIHPPASLGAVGDALASMLRPDPAGRPATLDALVGALAELARLPVPRVELDAFPASAATSDEGSDEPTQVADAPTDTERPPAPRASIPAPGLGFPSRTLPSRPLSSRPLSSRPLPSRPLPSRPLPRPALLDAPTERSNATLDMLLEGEGDDELMTTDPRQRPLPAIASDTAPHAALGADGEARVQTRGDDLDPRLVRAALAPEEAETVGSEELELVDTDGVGTKPRADDLDPRLVRAALGVSFDEAAVTSPRTKDRKPSSVTQELEAFDLEEVAPARAIAGAAKQGARSKAARPRREREVVPLPTGIKPIPRARRGDSSGEIKVAGPVLFDASKPTPRASPPPPSSPAAMAPIALPPLGAPGPGFATPLSPMAAAAPAHHAPAPVVPRASRPTMSRTPAWAGLAIVVSALVFALLIVAAALWYRDSLQRDAAAERQQMIEQRLRELQNE